MIGFFIGLFIGGIFGVIIMGLLAGARLGELQDERLEAELRRWQESQESTDGDEN